MYICTHVHVDTPAEVCPRAASFHSACRGCFRNRSCCALSCVCLCSTRRYAISTPRVRYVSALEVDGTKRKADADRGPKWMEASVESARTLDALLDLERQAVRELLCYSLWRLWLQAAVYVGDSSSGLQSQKRRTIQLKQSATDAMQKLSFRKRFSRIDGK